LPAVIVSLSPSELIKAIATAFVFKVTRHCHSSLEPARGWIERFGRIRQSTKGQQGDPQR
jgi:hypothetical protein